ncbi:hypothetical protein IHE45_16G064100 [Dioscorea alata]|uniref:Uncharacterized protein n=1 Tax=Dioscorea alata TaxID=55571 RepID=A0ACB7UI21_DIOAL|nr:hypothetical protein IHE45_16G064100 [Dioscorea alata]
MNNTIKKALGEKKSTRDLDLGKELIGECMNMKTYGYSGRDINKAYDWLMADDSRAMGFLAKDKELKKYWVENFFESIHNYGTY